MQKQKIYMQAWLEAHERTRIVATDQWYLDFANKLLPLVRQSDLYKLYVHDSHQKVVLTLMLYLEDCVADGGNWRKFIHWHHESYGRYLPFYSLTEAYLPDEINVEDIAFLLWGLNSPIDDEFYRVENPLDESLLEFAALIYSQLAAVFEDTPISDDLSADWLMETSLMEKKRLPLPEAVAGEELPTNVARFFEASGGESLMYFDSYGALKRFLVEALKWDDDEDGLLLEMKEFENFVLYANPKGILIGLDVATYFADKRNPLYNAQEAKEQAYNLFCEQGLSPFDLLKYAMEHHLLPDAQFPFKNGKALLQDNWDFVARWFLGEYYEAE